MPEVPFLPWLAIATVCDGKAVLSADCWCYSLRQLPFRVCYVTQSYSTQSRLAG
jgi:hypothetical protein